MSKLVSVVGLFSIPVFVYLRSNQYIKGRKQKDHRDGNKPKSNNSDPRFGTSATSAKLKFSRKREKRHNVSMQSNISVIVTEHADEYRYAIQQCVKPTDVALEVGCHQGVTTNKLSKHCKSVVGIDKSNFSIGKAKEQFPHIQFFEHDGYDVTGILRKTKGIHFDVIFLDVSGSVDVAAISTLIERYEKALKPRIIVAKCYRLVRLLNCCFTPDEYNALQTNTIAKSKLVDLSRNPSDEIQSTVEQDEKVDTKKKAKKKDQRVNTQDNKLCVHNNRMVEDYSKFSTVPSDVYQSMQPYTIDSIRENPISLSRALTLWSAIYNIYATEIPTALTIHILGVDPTEKQVDNQYPFLKPFFEICAANGVQKLKILLNGPHVLLSSNPIAVYNMDEGNGEQCEQYLSMHESDGICVELYCSNKLYHNTLSSHEKVDVAILFNAGLWGYPSWEPTIDVLLLKKCPTVVTCYNAWEADDEYDVVEQRNVKPIKGIQWLWKQQKNGFGSTTSRESGIPGRLCTENSYWLCFQGM